MFDDIGELVTGAVIGDSIGKIIFSDPVPDVDNLKEGFFERTKENYRRIGINWNYNSSNYHNCLTC